jgi:hypothetical protein
MRSFRCYLGKNTIVLGSLNKNLGNDLIVKTFMRTINWTSAMDAISDSWNSIVE